MASHPRLSTLMLLTLFCRSHHGCLILLVDCSDCLSILACGRAYGAYCRARNHAVPKSYSDNQRQTRKHEQGSSLISAADRHANAKSESTCCNQMFAFHLRSSQN